VDQTVKENLKQIFGFSQFRGNQENIVDNILNGRNTFVIMPTGAGKSLCYQLPAVIKEGTAIVISPLIALMKNQVDQLNAFNIEAHFLNSTLNKSETLKVRKGVLSGNTKLLYVAPESLTKEENVRFLKEANISFVAIDEAHCISEWGHDFRPEYRRIKSIIAQIGPKLPIIALTATATPKVQQDIQKNLQMEEADLFKSSFNRTNLYYEVRPKVKNETKKQIIKFIKTHKGKSGIIYCLSRKKVEEIAELLKVNGINSAPYHAGLDGHVRVKNQENFFCKKTLCVANQGHHFRPGSFQQRHKNFNFRSVATSGNTDNNILFLYHTQITMNGICCMHKYRGSSRRIQGRNNFVGNNGTFTNPSDHHTSF
jgi:ATP-dependent DNA helicase RecQ